MTSPKVEACAVPLQELLRSIPSNHRVCIPFQWAEDGTETGHHFIPVGVYMHAAADRIANHEAALTAAREEGARNSQFRPEGDNHHNAMLCPYCNPDNKIVKDAEERGARLAIAAAKDLFYSDARLQDRIDALSIPDILKAKP